MGRSVQFTGLESIERLEEKLSPTSQSVGGIIDTSTISSPTPAAKDDNPPVPEPPLPPYPGDNPPIDDPLGPPSGPAGPG
jgi:hypothetical protein